MCYALLLESNRGTLVYPLVYSHKRVRRRARARSSSDCAELLRCAPAAFVLARGALAVPGVRSECAFPLELGRAGSIWLARGHVRAPFSSDFRTFSWSSGRFDKKRSTLTKHCACAAKVTSERPAADQKSSTNRPGSCVCTSMRLERSKKSSGKLSGAFFGRSGAPRDLESVPGRYRDAPGVLWA